MLESRINGSVKGAIANFTATAGSRQVDLSWDNPSDSNISLYQFRSRSGNNWRAWRNIPNSSATTTSHTVTGLASGTTYHFQVRALVGTMRGAPSDALAATPVPFAPMGLTATPGDREVVLRWDNPNDSGITKYQYLTVEGNRQFPWANIPDSGSSTTTFAPTFESNGVRRTFFVRAFAGDDNPGPPSSVMAFTPLGADTTSPTVAKAIPDQRAIIRESFSYQFPDDSFTDPDPGDTLSYAATRGDGSALPAWLTFDPATRTFSGTPQAANAGTLTVKVTAKDSIDNTVSDSFDITVVAADAFVAFRRSDYESAEGARLVMRLRLSKSVPAKVDVYITSQDGTATKDDYSAGAETAPDGATNAYKVTFPANTTQAALLISLTDDTIFEPRESFSLRIHSIDSKAVIGFGSGRESVVSIQGNDHIILSPNAVTVTEAPGAGRTQAYTVKLAERPAANVDVLIQARSSVVTVSTGRLTFTPSNWNMPQEVTVTAVDNDIDQGDSDRTGIAHGLRDSSIPFETLWVTVADDDTAGLTFNPEALAVAQAYSGTYTVVLDSEPRDNVTVTVASDNIDVTPQPNTLTFTDNNWNMAQTVEVFTDLLGDDITKDSATLTHSARGGGYDSVTGNVEVTVTKLPSISLSVSASTVTEGAAALTLTATRSAANTSGAALSIPISVKTAGTTAQANDYTLAAAAISIPDNASTGTTTFAATDDNTDEPPEKVVIELGTLPDGHDTGSASEVAITIGDNDATSVTLAAAAGDVAEGGDKTFTITLNRGLVNGETLPVPLTFAGAATRNTDYTTACPDTLPTGVTCNDLDTAMTPTVTFTGPSTGATATTVTLTLSAIDDNTVEAGGETVVIGLGTLGANSGTGLAGGASGTDSLADFSITDPDSSAPTLEISGVPKRITDRAAFTVTFTFSESVTGFVTGDVTVANGDKSSFTGSGSSYAVVVTPNADADVTVTVDADSATDGTNTGPPADVVATAVFGAPAAPSVTATAGSAAVTLTWTDPSDDTITEYEFRQREEGGNWPNGWTDIPNSDKDTVSHAVTSLTNGTTYEFQVRAVSDAVDGTPSGTVSATPLASGAPAKPTGLTATAGGGSVTLSWTAPGGTITGYEIRQGTGDPVDWETWGAISGSDANTASTTVSSLTAGTAYSFQIRAVNNAVKGAMSDTASATPAAATVGFKAPLLTATENTNLTVTLALSNTVSADVDVYLTSIAQSATKGSDYAAGTVTSPDGTTGTYKVTITAGQTEGSTTIAITDDTEPEQRELFNLTIHEIASTVAIARSATTISAVIVRDDTDTAIALPDPATLTVTEAAGGTRTGTYNVALQLAPNATETVTVAVASQDAGVATVTPASLTFNADDWNTGKTVTVTGVDDEIDQDTDRTVAIRHTATSDIPSSLYTGRDSADLTVTVTDDDVTAPGVTTATTDDTATEGSTTDTATFTVVLDTEPSSDVTVAVTAPAGLTLDGPDSATTFTSSEDLTFTDSNWNTAQTVTVRATDDSTDSPIGRELTVTYAVTSSDSGYSGLSGDAAAITVVDNDPTAVALAGAAGDVAEGGTKTFTITLNRGLVNGEALPVPLTFGTGAGAATRGTDYTTACPSALPTGVACANLDSGNAMVTFTGPSTGTTATTVTLTLTAATDSTTEAGGETVAIGLGTLNASSGTGLEGGASGTDSLDDFSINDPNTAPVVANAISDRKAPTGQAFRYAFPANTFTDADSDSLTYTATRGDDSALPNWLTFTAATRTFTGTPASGDAGTLTVKVTADDGNGGTVSDSFDIEVAVAAATVQFASAEAAAFEEEEALEVDIDLSAAVSSAAVDVYISSGGGTATKGTDYTGGSATSPDGVTGLHKVTIAAGETSASLSIDLTDDNVLEGLESFTLTIVEVASSAVIGLGTRATATATIEEEELAVVLSPVRLALTEAAGGTRAGDVDVTLAVRPTADVTVAVAPDPATGVVTVGTGSLTFTSLNWNTAQTVTVTAVDDDIDQTTDDKRGAVSFNPTSSDTRFESETALSVIVADDDTAGLVFDPAALTVAEGGGGTYTVALDSEPTANVTVTVSSDNSDVTVDTDGDTGGNQNTLTFTAEDWETAQTVTVSAAADNDDTDDSATLGHSASGGGYGSVTGDVAVTVTEPVAAPAAPTSFTATAGNARVVLAWADPGNSDISGYQFRQGAGLTSDSTFSWGAWTDIASSGATTTGHTVTGLTNGTQYSFQVRARASGGSVEGTASAARTATPNVPPAAPASLAATAGNTQAVLSWTDPKNDDITKYQVRQGTGSTTITWGAWADIASSGATTTGHTVTGLTNGTEYSFQVRAVVGTVLGAASATASATPAAPPPRITGLATLASNGTVLLSWTDPDNDDITKYQYRQGTGTTVTWGEWTDMPGDNVFSGGGIVTYSVTGLTNGTQYSFQVRAVVGEMLGEPSDIATETPAIPPAKPSGLSAAAGDTKVDLSWTNPLNNAITKYQVQWGTTTNGVNTFGNWMDIAGSGASTTSHTVTGLTNGTAYNFRIRAFVGTAPGTTSDVVSATPVPPPAAPMGLTATGGNQQVVLSWTNPNNASITGYQYQQRTAGSNTWGSLTTISASNATTTTHTVTGLTNYTEYEFRLRVVNPAGGTNSDAVSATPRPANAPGAPTDFTAVAGPGGGQVTLSWTRPSGTITRQEYRVRSPGGDWPGWTNMRSATITTFVAPVGNEPLEFQMRARNGRVLGVLSAIVPATAVAAPAAPTSVTATAGATQVTLGWADPSNSDITKYQYSQRTPPGSGSWGSWTDFTGGTTAASTSGTVTGLTNGTAYEFRVRATAATGGTVLGAASTAVTATPTAAATAPAAPAGFTIDTGDTEIALKWIDPDNSDITKYQYRQGTGPLGSITWEDWTDIPNSDADTTEHTVTGLTNGTGYHFRVRAVAGTLNGAATDSTAITPVAKPAAPTGLTATAGATQVTLNWSDPGNATIEKYQVRYGAGLTTDSGFSWGTWADVSSSSATTTSATVTGLTNGTEYSFGVRAVGLSGDGAEATVVATPLAATAPAAPTSLTAAAGGSSVTLSWTAPGGTITGYEIRQGTGDPVTWGAWGPISASDANTASTTVGSLTAGTAYSFQIRAVNNAVKGAMSDTVSATPVAATVGFKAPLLTPTENTNLTVTLVLSQAVSADVDVYLTSTDLSASVTKGSDYAAGTATSPDGTTGTYEVTITAGQTEGSTTIAISDDTIPEESELFQLAIHEIASTVAIASGTPTTLDVIIADDTDTAIALPNPATLTVTEASGGTRTGTYNVALQLAPNATETVTVAVASQDAGVATVTPASLTFNADDWNTGKTVTVTGVDDEIDQDTDRTVAIRHTATSDGSRSLYTDRDPADLIVTVTDDDVTAPGVTTVQASDKAVDEADQTDTATFTVVLNTEPSAPVRVSLTPATGLALSTNGTNWGTSLQLYFATGSWSTAQTVMVRAATDSVDSPSARELKVAYAATSTDTDYSGLTGDAATVTVADDDATTVTLAGTAGDVVEGGTKTFTVTLGRGLVNGETLPVPLTFGGDATRGTDYTTACPTTLPTGVTCANLDSGTPTVTFTGPSTGATATTVTLTLSAASDSTTEAGGETVIIGLGTLNASSGTGLEGGASGTDSLADFKITDPDASAPTLEISGVPKRITTRAAFTVTFTFSESVTDFVTGDVTVANGDKSSFTGSGSSYAVVVTPNADADVTVTVDADSATDGTNTGPPADVVATAVFGAPAAPSVTATAGSAAVTLTWTDPSDDTITEYEFRQREEGGNWPNGWTDIPNSDKDTVSHAVTSLTNGTTYEFQVRAVSDAVDGTPSGTVSATPLAATAPGRPRDLRAAPGGGQVVLNWRVPGTNAGAITKYEFRQGTGDPLAWGAWGDASGTTTSHTVTSLTNGTEYSFQVRAVANTVLGAMSDTVEATPNPVPAAPTNFTATKGTASGAIALSWTAPSGTITRYEYRLRPVGGDWPQNWTRLNVPGATSFTVVGQTDGTEYEIELRAVNDSGAGAAASATATPLDPTAAAAPTSFTATAGSGQVDLTWTAPSGTITKYQVRQGTGDPVVWGAWADITGTTSHTVTGLTNGTEYSFQVRAVTGTSVPGAMSATATATPTAAPGVTFSVTDATVSEADRSDTATFTVVLNTRPSANVEMTINAPVGLEVDGPDLDSNFARTQSAFFSTTNWSTAQTVTVRASSESTDHPSSREEVIGYITISSDTDYIDSRGVGPTVTVVDNDATTVTLAGTAEDVAEGATKTFTVTLGRGLVDGETLGVPLAFTGTATRGTDYMTACPDTLPTGVTCNDLDDTSLTPTVTFTGPTTGATARTVTLTLTAATDSTTEAGGETVIIGFGTLSATGLEGGTSTTDSLADFKITDPDASVPTVAITGIPDKIKTTTALTATFTFSEAVTGFVKNDITVTGGTAGTFGGNGTTYTLGITPTSGSNVVVTVTANSATDGTNTGPASAVSATAVWDETAPTVEITGVPGKISNRDAFTVTFNFSETVTGFATGDVSVTNGDKSAFSGSGSSYTVVVTPNADADVTVTVAADSATDGLNTGPASAVSATATWDETAPTVEITGIPAKINNTNALTATFTFSEDVTGFVKNDITVTGGTAGTFTATSATVYTLAIIPTSGSNVVVTVAANSATDGTNTGPASAESKTATWDASVPTVGITGVPARISGTSDLTATFTFSEDVTGFVKNDITVTGGTAGTFTATSAKVYTLAITPDGDANVVVTVAADSATDGLNTGPASAESATAVWTALVFSSAAVTVVEEASATYTVALSSQPDGNVTVTVGGASGEVTFDTDDDMAGTQTTALTFSTTNWSTAQTVTVLAAADNDTANDSATLTHTAAGGGYGSVTGDVEVTVTDNDTPGLVLDPTALTVAEGGSGTYTVKLATQPTGTVTVTVAGASGDVTADTNPGMNGNQSTLEFTTTTWSTAQTVTVSADEDDDTTNDSATLTHSASGGGYGSATGSVAVTVTDDDTAGVTATQPTDKAVDEADQTDTATFTVVLDTLPSANVTVTVTAPAGLELDGPDAGSTFGSSEALAFTTGNWNAAQTVTVRAATDNVDRPSARELKVTYAATSTDTGYSGLTGDAATITVADDDATSVTLTGAAGDVVEGATKDFTITLNRGLVNGEALAVPLTFGGDATRNTDYTTACPTSLPTGVTCNNLNTDTTPAVTFTGPSTGATATQVTLTLTAATDSTTEAGGETVDIDLGTLSASSGTGLEGGASGTDSLADFSITDPDSTAPTVTITGIPDKIKTTTALTATFTFSEAVTDFVKNDITVTGGTAGAFGGSGTTYTLAITPTSGSNVVVTVAANSATDGTNTGPASAESKTATWDAAAPTVSITGVPARISGTGDLTATFTFSEDVTGFVKNDVTVTGGTAGTFTATSATVYTLVITPDGDANVVVTVDADSATDGLNTGPASAEAATAVWTALVFSSATVTVVEEASATYTVALSSQPDGNVTVTVGGASGEVTFDTDDDMAGTQTTALTFSTTNWSTAQTVTVLAAADNDTANDSATLTHTAAGGGYGSVTGDVEVTVTDNDTPGLVLDPTALTVAEGGSGTYTVKLATQPTGTVTVTVAGASGDVTADTNSVMNGDQDTLTFTTTNWNMAQTVTVSADEDDDTTNDSATLTHSASGGGYGSVTGDVAVTVTDDDTASLVIDPTALTVAEGGSGTYTVKLATQPTGNVTVTVAGASGEVTVDTDATAPGNQSTLTFTDSTWSTARTVTVSAGEDNDGVDDSATLAHSASGGGYGSVTGSVEVTVTDDDTAPAAPAGFTAAAGDQQVALSWTDPGNSAIDSWQFRQRTPPGTGAWGSWTVIASSTATTTTHTVTGLTNGTDYGFQVRAVDGTIEGAASAEATATPAPPVTVAFAAGSAAVTVAEGDDSHAELTLALSAARGAATRVRLVSVDTGASAGADFAAGPYTVDFPAGDTRATLRIAIEDDNLPEESEAFKVTIAALNLPAGVSVGAPSESIVTIRDDDKPPPAPTGLTATPGAGSVALAWRYAPPAAPAVDRTADFQYRRGTGDPVSWGAWTTIPGSGPGTRSHTARGLAGGTDYAFQVRARSLPGSGFRLGLESATARATPAATPEAALAGKVRAWMAEASCAAEDDCVAHWKRALKALGEAGADLADVEPMTFGEALTLAYTPASLLGYTPAAAHGARWLEVAKALRAMEVERVAITIAASPAGPVAEGAEVTFTLTAAAAPSTTFDVFVDVADAPEGDFLADDDEGRRRVRLKAGETTATFTVKTRDDGADEPDGAIAATLAALPSVYTLGSPASASVQVTDNDGEGGATGLTTATTDGEATEGSTTDTATFTVVLDTEPTASVTVTVTAPAGLTLDGPDGATAFTSSEPLAFTTGNWNSAQTVTVRATDDSTDSPIGRELTVTYAAASSDDDYSGLSGDAATVTVVDNDPTTVTLAGTAGDVVEGAAKTFTITLGRGLVDGETLPMPLTFGGDATRNTDYTVACPDTLPDGVTCNNLNTETTPTVTFTGPSTGATATEVTLTLSAATDNTAEVGGETVAIGLGTLNASSGTGLEGGASGTDNLDDFSITDPNTAPVVATGLTAVAGDQQVALSWTDPSNSAIDSWQFRQRTPPDTGTWGSWTAIASSTATTTTHTVTGLTNGTAYGFQVRAVAGTLQGTESSEATATPGAECELTNNLAADIQAWRGETGHGQEHIDRWTRVLIALGVERGPLAPMSLEEAQDYLGRGWNRWKQVVADLRCKEMRDATLPAVTVSAGGSVTEGENATFTLAVSSPPAADLTVKYYVSDAEGADFVDADNEGAKTMIIGTGEWPKEIPVATRADENTETNGPVTVTLNPSAGYRVGAPASAQVTVMDDDAPPGAIEVSIDDATVSEGGTMKFRITLSAPAPGLTLVFWRTRQSSPVSARQNVDYRGRDWVMFFYKGQRTKQAPVPTVNDAHDEGDETFEVVIESATLHRGQPLTITKAVAKGTITNSDPLPAAYLARFGRTVAEQALEGIADRIGAPRTPGTEGAFAGTALGASTDDEAAAEIGREGGCVMSALGRDSAPDTDGAKAPIDECAAMETRAMGEGEALLGSHFTFTRPADATGGTLAFWGRASRNTFDGAERDAGTAITLEGTVTTALLGADYARGDWLFGLALTQSTSEGSYSGGGAPGCSEAEDEGPTRCDSAGGAGSGAVDASLSAALPYASVHATPRLKLWGAAGLGAGEVTLKTQEARYRADTEWTMAAAGLRSDLLDAGTGPTLALTADALWTRTASERTRDLAASDSDVTRLRLGVEGRYRFALADDSQLTPRLETGVRHDGGDAETGLGVELGGGLALSAPTLGLTLDVSGRTLIAHDDDDLKDRGLSAALTFDPRPESARGPSLSLRQDVGDRAEGGLDALFAPDPLAERTESTATARWTLEGAWGFSALGGRFTAGPHAALGLSPDTRDATLGWRLTPQAPAAPDLTFDVKATRREDDLDAPEHTVGIEATVRW